MLSNLKAMFGLGQETDDDDDDDIVNSKPVQTPKKVTAPSGNRRPGVPAGVSRAPNKRPTQNGAQAALDKMEKMESPPSESKTPVSESEAQTHTIRPATPSEIRADSHKGENASLVVQPQRGVSTKNNITPVDPSEEELDTIRKYAGHVLTSKLPELSQKHCAFLANGWFLVDRGNPTNARISSVRSELLRSQRIISKTFLVPMSLIRTVYDNYELKHGSNKTAYDVTEIRGLEAQKFQKEVLALIENAYKQKVSDIHVFVRDHHTEIKFRINGELEMIKEEDAAWGHQLCQTAFSMSASSDSSYLKGEYQGARIASNDMPLTPGVQSIRVQLNPLPAGGRYMVCRLLLDGGRGDDVTLSQLGYQGVHIRTINTMRRQAEGVTIIAGPTGSGKSTTLVIVIQNDMKENPGNNVITVEDPPEFIIAGAAQFAVVNANDEASKTVAFQKALNAALRSDPDTVMIGEIRDRASASLAFKAAQTGHRVYASLHATNAVAILGRLREIEVPLYNLTEPSLVAGLIGQRLVRKLCPHCRIPIHEATPEQLAAESLDDDLIRRCREIHERGADAAKPFNLPTSGIYITNHEGCKHCRRGISGRAVVSETIAPELDFMTAFKNGSTNDAMEIWLRDHNGMTMHEHALQRMIDGISSPRDVIGMTGDIMKFDMSRCEKVFGELMKP